MWKEMLLLAALAALTVPERAWGQNGAGWSHEEGEPYVAARMFVVPSETLGEDRRIAVGLPRGFDSTAAYPVIYVMDGLGHMLHTLGSARFLAARDRMPPAIVVTIDNTEGNRTRDMTPLPTSDAERAIQRTAGGADDFMAFMRDELKPWIETRYPTRPYDVLIGHSLGGLFISHVLNTQPDLFDAYIAISPSLWWDEERYVAGMDDVFDRFPDAKGALYMTMGNEGGDMLSGAWRLASILEKHAPDGFRWHWQRMPAETHGSVPARSTYDGLEWIFSGWYPMALFDELVERGAPVLPRIQAHYAEASEEFGWEVEMPIYTIVETVWRFGQEDRADDALELAEALMADYPGSHLSHVAMGEAHRAACRLTEARRSMTDAVEMAEEQGESADFPRNRLEEVEAVMEEGDCPPSRP